MTAPKAGGFAGIVQNGGTIASSYWDVLLSGVSAGIGVPPQLSGVAVIDVSGNPDPTLASTYAGFDFTNVWVITAGNRPTLLGMN